jgi:hypothetical protein
MSHIYMYVCIVLNGLIISKKIMHKSEERSDCVLSMKTAGTHMAGLESAKKNL